MPPRGRLCNLYRISIRSKASKATHQQILSETLCTFLPWIDADQAENWHISSTIPETQSVQVSLNSVAISIQKKFEKFHHFFFKQNDRAFLHGSISPLSTNFRIFSSRIGRTRPDLALASLNIYINCSTRLFFKIAKNQKNIKILTPPTSKIFRFWPSPRIVEAQP